VTIIIGYIYFHFSVYTNMQVPFATHHCLPQPTGVYPTLLTIQCLMTSPLWPPIAVMVPGDINSHSISLQLNSVFN